MDVWRVEGGWRVEAWRGWTVCVCVCVFVCGGVESTVEEGRWWVWNVGVVVVVMVRHVGVRWVWLWEGRCLVGGWMGGEAKVVVVVVVVVLRESLKCSC